MEDRDHGFILSMGVLLHILLRHSAGDIDLGVRAGSGLLREQGGESSKLGHVVALSAGGAEVEGGSDDEGSHRGSERKSK